MISQHKYNTVGSFFTLNVSNSLLPWEFRKIINIFLKQTKVEYNHYNNSFDFIIPNSCDSDIRQSFFSFCRGGGAPPSQVLGKGALPAAPPLDAPLDQKEFINSVPTSQRIIIGTLKDCIYLGSPPDLSETWSLQM